MLHIVMLCYHRLLSIHTCTCIFVFPSISHFMGYWTGRYFPGNTAREIPPWYFPDNTVHNTYYTTTSVQLQVQLRRAPAVAYTGLGIIICCGLPNYGDANV